MEAIVGDLCFPKPVDNKKIFLWAICSWKTGAPKNNYSRKVMTARAVLGQPAVENAVSRKDIFSEEYSYKERAAGRDRIKEKINELLSDPKRTGILFVDRNPVVFHDTDSPHKDIHAFLQSYDGFVLVLNLRDEIYVYKHKRHNHAILVHGSLCLASSSIEGVSMEQRTNRGLTAGVLCNVQRYFNGLEPLSDEVTDGGQ